MAENQKQRERIGWGKRVPALSFESAIALAKSLGINAGLDGSLDALSRIMDNSRSSSTFNNKLSVLRGFRLLTTPDKNHYSLTEIGKRVVTPTQPDDEVTAIFECFLSNEILKGVFEQYKSKVLPQAEFLANHIEKLGIPSELKGQWAEYFLDAAKFVGLIHEKESGGYQLLSQPLTKTEPTARKIPQPVPEVAEARTASAGSSVSQELMDVIGSRHWGILNQRKLSGDKKAIFAIPDELTQAEIDILKVILKGIEAGLDGLKKVESDEQK